MKKKIILVACDLSDYTTPCIKLASELATGLNAGLSFVNIINQRDLNLVERVTRYSDKITVEGFVKETKKLRTDEFNKVLDKLGLASSGHHLKYRVGVPFRELLKAIDEENAAFLVMGVRGNSDLEDAIFGSTAQKVFRRCPITLLSVRVRDEIS